MVLVIYHQKALWDSLPQVLPRELEMAENILPNEKNIYIDSKWYPGANSPQIALSADGPTFANGSTDLPKRHLCLHLKYKSLFKANILTMELQYMLGSLQTMMRMNQNPLYT